jgi:hypothetical protein
LRPYNGPENLLEFNTQVYKNWPKFRGQSGTGLESPFVIYNAFGEILNLKLIFYGVTSH